jgi:hypothetical protein
MNAVQVQQLAAYRACSRIEAVYDRDEDGFKPFDRWVCANDGLPVIRRLDQKWRHHPDFVRHLARLERGES